MGGMGGGLGTLASKSDGMAVRGGAVLSGVTSPGLINERVAGASTGAGGGMPMSPGAGAHGAGGGDRTRRESVVLTSSPAYVESPRGPASGANRDLFS